MIRLDNPSARREMGICVHVGKGHSLEIPQRVSTRNNPSGRVPQLYCRHLRLVDVDWARRFLVADLVVPREIPDRGQNNPAIECDVVVSHCHYCCVSVTPSRALDSKRPDEPGSTRNDSLGSVSRPSSGAAYKKPSDAMVIQP